MLKHYNQLLLKLLPNCNRRNIKIIKQGSAGSSRQKPGDQFTDPSRRDPWADRPEERRPPPFDDPYYRYYGPVNKITIYLDAFLSQVKV